MNPGELNKRITINNFTNVADGSGGLEESLTPVKTVWANVRPVSGREFYQAAQAQVEISHVITVRYDSAINRTQVITMNSKQYHIQYAMEVGNKQFLEIQVVEKM